MMKDLHAKSFEVTFLGDFSKKLVTNTLFNMLGRSWSFLINLLLTPYILSRLNVGDFGVWVLLSIFISSFNLLDLGLGFSFVRFIAAYHTHEDYDRINKVLFSGLVFYGVLGVLAIGVGLLIEKPLLGLFRISNASEVYFLVLLTCAVSNIGAMFLSVFKGIQRMDKQNSIEIALSIANAVGTVFFLQTGFGIHGLALNALINASLTVCLTFVVLRSVVPKISLGWNFDTELLREMFDYGFKISVSRIGSLVCFQADKLIVSRVLGLAAVSFYEVAARLTAFMRAIPLVMLSALIPATSELGARQDRERIQRTYLLVSKYIAILTVAVAALLVLNAGSIVRLWIGKGFDQSAFLIQILAIGYSANILGGAASQIGAGVGRPEYDMRSTLLLAIANPLLSFLLVRKFGAPGAAAGTSLALIMAVLYLLFGFQRNYMEMPVGRVLAGIYLRPIVSGILAIAAVAGFHSLVPGLASFSEIRYLIPIKLAADFAIFTPVYIVLLLALRQISVIDWNNFQWLVAFGIEFLRHPMRERVKVYR
jgi:O-antigen/teichoic acid export membrane protein